MSSEVLLAVAGVLIGWFLNELAGAFRVAREERQLVCQALPPLLALYFEQYRINDILSFYNQKMGDDFERLVQEAEKEPKEKGTIGAALNAYLKDFEEHRQNNVKLPKTNFATLVSDFGDATDPLSRVDPVSAFRAKQLLAEFLLFRDIQMPVSRSAPVVYMNFLETVLSVYRNDMVALRSLILRVARRASFLDFWRVRALIIELEKELDGGIKRATADVFERV